MDGWNTRERKLRARWLGAFLLAAALAPATAVAGSAPGFSAPNGCKNPVLQGLSSAGFPRVLPLTYFCPFEPRTDCVGASLPGGSKLLMKEGAADPRGDRVRWRLSRGGASVPADLGDPTVDTDYELCIYVEAADVCELVLHPDALAGAGWRARRNGFEFIAKPGKHAEGLRRIRLRTGPAGKTQVLVKGKGPLLGLDALPLPADAAILVQLYNGADRCFSTEFGQAPLVQDDRRFKDRSD